MNWDLKRDIEPQMKKLRAATDRAIIELIRECAREPSARAALALRTRSSSPSRGACARGPTHARPH